MQDIGHIYVADSLPATYVATVNTITIVNNVYTVTIITFVIVITITTFTTVQVLGLSVAYVVTFLLTNTPYVVHEVRQLRVSLF